MVKVSRWRVIVKANHSRYIRGSLCFTISFTKGINGQLEDLFLDLIGNHIGHDAVVGNGDQWYGKYTKDDTFISDYYIPGSMIKELIFVMKHRTMYMFIFISNTLYPNHPIMNQLGKEFGTTCR